MRAAIAAFVRLAPTPLYFAKTWVLADIERVT